MYENDDDLDRLAELADLWPYDGPHSPHTVTAAAQAIWVLVRYINNATSLPGRYSYMSQVARVANSLADAVFGLNQLLDQMRRDIDRHIATGRLYDDHCLDDPDAGTLKADLAVNQLVQAQRGASVLAEQLSELGNTANTIGHR